MYEHFLVSYSLCLQVKLLTVHDSIKMLKYFITWYIYTNFCCRCMNELQYGSYIL
jgi:hypothetical protein